MAKQMKIASRKRNAFTLIELMVVFSIAAIVMSLGIGAYINLNRDLTWHSSVTSVTSLLQAARSSAIETRTPVSVILKTEPLPENTSRKVCLQAYATLTRRIGTWHFEAPTGPFAADTELEGAFSQKATPVNMENAELVRGRIGRAIKFKRWENGSEVNPPQSLIVGDEPVQGQFRKIPAYDLREGLKVSCWINPELPAAPAETLYYPVFAKPSVENPQSGVADDLPVYSLSLIFDPNSNDQFFRLSGLVRVIKLIRNADGLVEDTEQHILEIRSKPLIRPNMWTHISMTYIGADSESSNGFVRIYINDNEIVDVADGPHTLDTCLIDGVEVDSPTAAGQILVSDQPAMVGSDGADYFNGAIDELMIDAVSTSGRVTPRDTVTFRFWNLARVDDTYRIDFDRTGKLAGTSFPLIALYSSGAEAATMIGVERSGSIKTWNLNADSDDLEAAEWRGAGGN